MIRVRVGGFRIKVSVKVSLRVKFIFLFCRSIALLLVFYAFRICSLQFHIIPLPVPAGGMKRQLHLLRALLICYNTVVLLLQSAHYWKIFLGIDTRIHIARLTQRIRRFHILTC